MMHEPRRVPRFSRGRQSSTGRQIEEKYERGWFGISSRRQTSIHSPGWPSSRNISRAQPKKSSISAPLHLLRAKVNGQLHTARGKP